MRAARTDKGVHAACNVVSLKMICQDPQLVQKLNYVLPPPIRIWGKLESSCTPLKSNLNFRLCGNTTYFSCKDKM